MQKMGPQVFARVTRVNVVKSSYEMAKLVPLDLTKEDPLKLLVEYKAQLAKIWEYTGSYKQNPLWATELLLFLGKVQAPADLSKWLRRVAMRTFAPSAIHGDATFGNAARTTPGELRLLDPLPYSPKIPASRLVDYGKLLQSILGWEFAPAAPPWDMNVLGLELCRGLSVQDVDVIHFWAAVALQRIKPYTQRADLLKWIEDRTQSILCP